MEQINKNKSLTINCEKVRYFVIMSLSSVKILSFSFALLSLITASVCGFAQNKDKHLIKKEKHPISIGFQSGRELLFNSSPLVHSKQSKVHYGISKSLVLRKPINAHFKLESGISYSNIQCCTPNILALTGKQNNTLKTNKFSFPVTVQYYFLPEKCKVRPFCGAGLQYCFADGKNNPVTNTCADVTQQYYNPQPDTKYITILFTQGVTFEVNTKIEITQSFHFIPENTNNVIGIDLGIGFKIP